MPLKHEQEIIAEFVAELTQSGFAAFLAAFPPHLVSIDGWARHTGALDQEPRRLAELFLLGRPVPHDQLPPPVAAVVPALAEHGILAEADGTVRVDGVALFRPHGVWLFAEPPSPFLPRHYFGADSLALASHATCRSSARVLDLCAGPGFQGLVAADRGRCADLVEIEPGSARLAELNVLLNSLQDRVQVYCGDLYAPLDPDAQYDHVVANIPFIPIPPHVAGTSANAGRQDGFAVGRSILAGLPQHLAPGGSSYLSALLLRAGDKVLMHGELTEWADQAGCAVTATLTSMVPVDENSDLVQATASDLGEMTDGRLDHDEAAAQVAALYADQGATAASLAFLSIQRSPTPGLRVLDLGRNNPVIAMPWVS